MAFKMKGSPMHHGTAAHKSALKDARNKSHDSAWGKGHTEHVTKEEKSKYGPDVTEKELDTIYKKELEDRGGDAGIEITKETKHLATPKAEIKSPTKQGSPGFNPKKETERKAGAKKTQEAMEDMIPLTGSVTTKAKKSPKEFSKKQTWPGEGVKPRPQTKKDKKADKKLIKKANKIFSGKQKDIKKQSKKRIKDFDKKSKDPNYTWGKKK